MSKRIGFARLLALSILATSLALGGVILPSIAGADPTLATVEAGPWPAAIAALQADLHSEGRVLHLYVAGERGERLACNSFEIVPDLSTLAAFTAGACDERNRSVPLRLDHRAALFRHNEGLPQPAALGITAREVHSVHVESDSRAVDATNVRCSVAVTPALQDLARGTRVELSPDRFELRPVRSNISASPTATGWSLAGTGSAAITVEYDIVDRQTHQVVLHDRATLACGADPGTVSGASGDCAAIPVLAPGQAVASDIRSALDVDRNAPGRLYRIVLPTRSVVSVNVQGTFSHVTPTLFRGCGVGNSAHDQLPRRHSYALQPGTYTLLISSGDGATRPGEFTVVSEVIPIQPDASDAALPELRFDETVHGLLVPQPGNTTQAMYRCHVDQAMHIEVHAVLNEMPGWDFSDPDLTIVASVADTHTQGEVLFRRRLGSSRQSGGNRILEASVEPGDYVVWLHAFPHAGFPARGYSLELVEVPGQN